MKKYFLLLPVALMMIGMIACSEPGCVIEGHTSFKEYQTAYLIDSNHHRLDSIKIEDGKFSFRKPENVTNPYVLMVHLQDNKTNSEWIEMPVFIENGTVIMEISDHIKTSGTSLNENLQNFYNALQHNKDAMKAKKDVTLQEIETTFSEFYKQQILENKDNALGKYIYNEYGRNLKNDDLKQVKAQIGN